MFFLCHVAFTVYLFIFHLVDNRSGVLGTSTQQDATGRNSSNPNAVPNTNNKHNQVTSDFFTLNLSNFYCFALFLEIKLGRNA